MDSSNNLKMSLTLNYKLDLRKDYRVHKHKTYKYGEPKTYCNPRRARIIKFEKTRLRRFRRRNPYKCYEGKWPFS